MPFFLNHLRHDRPVLTWLVILTIGVSASFAHGDDAATKDKEEGFTPLVRGDSHEGWTGYAKKGWPKGWEAADGVLHLSSGGGDLMTEKEYGDFDLRFDWKISKGGNSGVLYRVSPGLEPPHYTGPEYQVLDNAGHQDGKSLLTSAGALYGLYASTADASKPAEEWNRGRIVMEGDRVRHFLNGQKLVDAQIGSDDWKARVAKSKFTLWTQFAKNPRGRIVLQDHGNEVWFRKLRIKEVKELDGPAAK